MAKEKKNITIEARQRYWRYVCNEYLETFCKKHKYTYGPDMWVGSDPGTIANVSDMFIKMDDIRYDIDNNVPEEYFSKWYWKSVELDELGVDNYMNYPSYCKGAPDEWTEARMQVIREAQMKIVVLLHCNLKISPMWKVILNQSPDNIYCGGEALYHGKSTPLRTF